MPDVITQESKSPQWMSMGFHAKKAKSGGEREEEKNILL